MAKIKYASFVAGLAGKSGSTVFFRSASQGFGYMRAFVQPTYTTTNEDRGKEMKNMAIQYNALTAPAKLEFKTYASRYKNLPAIGGDLASRANNGMACFVLMFWNIHKANPLAADLKTLTLDDIILFDATRISSAVLAGFLPAVPGYDELYENFVG